MKLGIIGGAGLLGATTAFYAGSKNILEEILIKTLKIQVITIWAIW